MKQADLLKLGDKVWVRKRKGYRIQCREYRESERVDVLMPSETELPMESDVACWRLAFKLSVAEGTAPDGKPLYTEITIIDDLGETLDYYVTGKPEVLNRE